MTILFAGGEPECFTEFNGLLATGSTSFDGNYARATLGVSNALGHHLLGEFAPTTAFWLGMRIRITSYIWSSSYGPLLELFDAAGVCRIRMKPTTDETVQVVAVNEGGTETLLGTSSIFSSGTSDINSLQVEIDYSATGKIQIYFNNVSLFLYEGDVTTNSVTELAAFKVKSPSSGYAYLSEVIVSTTDTRAMRLKTLVPNAAGDTNDWTGAYTDINGVTPAPTSVVTSDMSGQVFTANLGDLTASTEVVEAVSIATHAVRGEDLTGGVELGVRTDGTNAFVAPVELDILPTSQYALFPANPVTEEAWTRDEVNALQVALRSAS